MKKALMILCSVLLPFTIMAQEATFDKAELKQVKKMVKKQSLRKPIPFVLQSDLNCMEFVHNMYNLSEQEVAAVVDSVSSRNKENDFILQRIAKAVDEETAIEVQMQIHREQLRSDAFDINYNRYLKAKEASRRTMPDAELIYIEYNYGGMLFYPLMPASITKIDDQKARVAWGGSFNEKSFETDASILKEYYKFIKDKYLYKLVSSYDDHSLDNLPDLGGPWQKLDGMSWHFEAKFADGTYISAGGDDSADKDLHLLQIKLEKLIKEHIGVEDY